MKIQNCLCLSRWQSRTSCLCHLKWSIYTSKAVVHDVETFKDGFWGLNWLFCSTLSSKYIVLSSVSAASGKPFPWCSGPSTEPCGTPWDTVDGWGDELLRCIQAHVFCMSFASVSIDFEHDDVVHCRNELWASRQVWTQLSVIYFIYVFLFFYASVHPCIGLKVDETPAPGSLLCCLQFVLSRARS